MKPDFERQLKKFRHRHCEGSPAPPEPARFRAPHVVQAEAKYSKKDGIAKLSRRSKLWLIIKGFQAGK